LYAHASQLLNASRKENLASHRLLGAGMGMHELRPTRAVPCLPHSIFVCAWFSCTCNADTVLSSRSNACLRCLYPAGVTTVCWSGHCQRASESTFCENQGEAFLPQRASIAQLDRHG